jgi:hypothetical protein
MINLCEERSEAGFMDGKRASVFGLYQNPALAEGALDQLTAARFASDDVSVLMQAAPGRKGSDGTLGLLAGFAPLTIPKAGPLIGAGPIRSLLAVQHSTEEGLDAALVGLGFPEHEARSSAASIREGGVLLAVSCRTPEDAGRAAGVLKSIGAETVTLVGEGTASLDAARIGP